MINAKEFKKHLDSMIEDVEGKTEKWTMQTRTLLNNLIAARRICDKMIADIAILEMQGQDFFEATATAPEKKPIKIQKPKK